MLFEDDYTRTSEIQIDKLYNLAYQLELDLLNDRIGTIYLQLCDPSPSTTSRGSSQAIRLPE